MAACQAKLLLLPWAIALIFQWQSTFSTYPPFTDLPIDYCSTLFRPDMHTVMSRSCIYNLYDNLCNHLMFYYVYMPLRGPFNLD